MKSAVGQTEVKSNMQGESTLMINCSPELFSLTSDWAKEFEKLNPSVKVVVNPLIGQQSPAESGLSFVSLTNQQSDDNNRDWRMAIGLDAIVPVINAKNPMLAAINSQGISNEKFIGFFADSQKRNWSNLIVGGQAVSAQCFITDNEFLSISLSDFAKTNMLGLKDLNVF